MARFKSKFATLVILVVSASAFAAGYLQNYYVEEANAFYEKSSENQINVGRIEQEAKRRYDADVSLSSQSEEAIIRGWELAQEYIILETDLTENQKSARLSTIYSNVFDVNYYLFKSNAWDIFDHFFGTTETEYKIASEEVEGYDYLIFRNEYDENFPLETFTIDQYLSDEWGYPQTVIDDIKIRDPSLAVFGVIDFTNLNTLLSLQLWFQQDQVVVNKESGDAWLERANSLTQSVSITTVAVVLATAMATRVNEKEQEKNIETILANLGDEVDDIKVHDIVSVPVLSVAIILSLAGFILAIG